VKECPRNFAREMCGNLDFVSRREKQKVETLAEMA
jgi:hypothetical protein